MFFDDLCSRTRWIRRLLKRCCLTLQEIVTTSNAFRSSKSNEARRRKNTQWSTRTARIADRYDMNRRLCRKSIFSKNPHCQRRVRDRLKEWEDESIVFFFVVPLSLVSSVGTELSLFFSSWSCPHCVKTKLRSAVNCPWQQCLSH